MLASFLCVEFLLHILSWLPLLYLGSIPHTSRAAFIFIWGVSLTHPMLALFFCGEFLLRIPCWLFFFPFFFKSRGFLLPIPCWLRFHAGSFSYTSRTGFIFYLGSFSYTSHACFIFLWGVSLTHPMLASVLRWVGMGFSYTSHTGFIFICGVSLTHPMLAFCVGSFSYTSHAGFFSFFL